MIEKEIRDIDWIYKDGVEYLRVTCANGTIIDIKEPEIDLAELVNNVGS